MKTIRLSLRFSQSIVNKSIMSDIIKKYDVDVNILHADISITKIGRLIVDIGGSEKSLEDVIKHLNNNGVEYEFFEKSILRDEDKCIDCGVCTGVCSSQALYLEKDSAKVLFDPKKCIICGFCVKTCPIKIIKIEGDLFNV